ncbi:MAG: tetratricopeptide repeat protein [Crocinitomicaceae bacterium]|nr:tetratricopeptide repeat protein [Crocinitomicaceae bacterium]
MQITNNRIAIVVLLISFLSFITGTNTAFGQDTTNATIDSLIMSLMTDEEDTNRVNTYNNLSDEYLNLDYRKSIEYSKLATELAKELNFKSGLLRAQLALGHLEMAYLLNYEKSRKIYNDALPIAKELKDRKSEMIIYKWLGYIYGAQEMFGAAINYNEKALEIAEELQSDKDISDVHAYMGGLSEESGDTVSAIDHYAEVLAIERKNDFRETSNASMIVIARYYFLIDDHGQALKYYRIALKNFERMDDQRWVSYTHAEMGRLHIATKDFERAERHAFKGLEIAQQYEFNKEIGDNYLVLYEVYTAMDSSAKAQEYKAKYDSMQTMLNPVSTLPVTAEEKKETVAGEVKSKMNGFVQSFIILIPVVLLVVFAGMPSRKKA